MRYRDILSEMPMVNFGLLGDMSQPGSMEDNDRRAITNPKWQAKLIKQFSKAPHDINIYLMNVANRKMRNTQHYRISGENGVETVQNPIDFKVDVFNIEKFAGFYSPEDFENNFGFLPPNYQQCINVLLAQNDGSDKFPLTPWIVGHRVMHAISNQSKHWSRNDEVPQYYDRYFVQIQSSLRDLAEITGLSRNAVIARAATMKSAKAGFKDSRMGEFYIELSVQALLFGNFTFDLSSFDLGSSDRQRIEDGVAEARNYLKQAIDGCVSKLVVF